MTQDEIDRLRALCDEQEGRWHLSPDQLYVLDTDGWEIARTKQAPIIVESVNALPALLSGVERLRALLRAFDPKIIGAPPDMRLLHAAQLAAVEALEGKP